MNDCFSHIQIRASLPQPFKLILTINMEGTSVVLSPISFVRHIPDLKLSGGLSRAFRETPGLERLHNLKIITLEKSLKLSSLKHS